MERLSIVTRALSKCSITYISERSELYVLIPKRSFHNILPDLEAEDISFVKSDSADSRKYFLTISGDDSILNLIAAGLVIKPMVERNAGYSDSPANNSSRQRIRALKELAKEMNQLKPTLHTNITHKYSYIQVKGSVTEIGKLNMLYMDTTLDRKDVGVYRKDHAAIMTIAGDHVLSVLASNGLIFQGCRKFAALGKDSKG